MDGYDMFVDVIRQRVNNGTRAVARIGAYPGKVEICMVNGTYVANFWDGNGSGKRRDAPLSDMPKGPTDEDYRKASENVQIY